MHLAKISSTDQMTAPVEAHRKLHLKEGNKLLFIEQDGEIIPKNASTPAIVQAQEAFAGTAKDFGVADAADVQGSDCKRTTSRS